MRPRKPSKKGLPPNCYEDHGYYSYRNPVTKRTIGLGRDRRQAIDYSLRANQAHAVKDAERHSLRVEAKMYATDLVDKRGMLEPHVIAAKSVKFAVICGVYFLLDGVEIVYVGQGIDCYRRVCQHYAEGKKKFDAYYIIPCAVEGLDDMEAMYIAKFGPKLNAVKPRDPGKEAWGFLA